MDAAHTYTVGVDAPPATEHNEHTDKAEQSIATAVDLFEDEADEDLSDSSDDEDDDVREEAEFRERAAALSNTRLMEKQEEPIKTLSFREEPTLVAGNDRQYQNKDLYQNKDAMAQVFAFASGDEFDAWAKNDPTMKKAIAPLLRKRNELQEQGFNLNAKGYKISYAAARRSIEINNGPRYGIFSEDRDIEKWTYEQHHGAALFKLYEKLCVRDYGRFTRLFKDEEIAWKHMWAMLGRLKRYDDRSAETKRKKEGRKKAARIKDAMKEEALEVLKRMAETKRKKEERKKAARIKDAMKGEALEVLK